MYGHNATHNFKHIEQAGVSQGAIYKASKHEMFKPYTSCVIRIHIKEYDPKESGTEF
jgi:hypothetical protein